MIKYMKKNLDMTKPHCSKQILSVPWPFVISRFHTVIGILSYLDYSVITCLGAECTENIKLRDRMTIKEIIFQVF